MWGWVYLACIPEVAILAPLFNLYTPLYLSKKRVLIEIVDIESKAPLPKVREDEDGLRDCYWQHKIKNQDFMPLTKKTF